MGSRSKGVSHLARLPGRQKKYKRQKGGRGWCCEMPRAERDALPELLDGWKTIETQREARAAKNARRARRRAGAEKLAAMSPAKSKRELAAECHRRRQISKRGGGAAGLASLLREEARRAERAKLRVNVVVQEVR